MRRLIAIALSLLCIALPLRSVADALVSGKHCPQMQERMQADAHAHHSEHKHSDMQAESQDLAAAQAESSGCCEGCCHDAASHAAGQLCKMGQTCSTLMTFLLPPAVAQTVIAVPHADVTTEPKGLYTRLPTAVWRPPSLS